MNGTKMETEASKLDWDSEGHLRVLERQVTRSRKDMLEACRRAIECLERFAAEARRELERSSELEPVKIVDLPGKILAASAWGTVNAASELSSAQHEAAICMKAMGELEAKKAVRGRAAP
jgi:hypothetical protein